jgi:hypothetical protein
MIADLDDLREALKANIEPLALALIDIPPNRALSTRRQLRFGSKGGLCVEIGGPKQGLWINRGDGAEVGGDPIALIRDRRGGNFNDAIAWARNWLGWPSPHCDAPADPMVALRRQVERRRQEAEREAARLDDEAKRTAAARAA